MIERKEKNYLSCPCCNKLLFRYEGSFNIEVKCSKCNKDIVVLVHENETTVFENRRHGIARKGKVTRKLAFVS